MNSPRSYELLNTDDLLIVGAVDNTRRPQTLAVNSPNGSVDLSSTKLHTAVRKLRRVRRTLYVPAQGAGGVESMVINLAVRLDRNSMELSELVVAIQNALLKGKK